MCINVCLEKFIMPYQTKIEIEIKQWMEEKLPSLQGTLWDFGWVRESLFYVWVREIFSICSTDERTAVPSHYLKLTNSCTQKDQGNHIMLLKLFLFRCEWWWGGFTNKQNMRHVKTHQVHTRSMKGLVPKYSCTKIREKRSSYPFHTQYLP